MKLTRRLSPLFSSLLLASWIGCAPAITIVIGDDDDASGDDDDDTSGDDDDDATGDDDDDSSPSLALAPLAAAWLMEPYDVGLEAADGGDAGGFFVSGLPAGLEYEPNGRVFGTPREFGAFPLVVQWRRDGADQESNLDFVVEWDSSSDAFYAAVYFEDGEMHNMAEDMYHPWLRLAGTGYGAEEEGDEQTVRQIRVGLFHEGPNGRRNEPWRGSYDDVLVRVLTEECTFLPDSDGFHTRPCTGGCGDGDGYGGGDTSPGPDDRPWSGYGTGAPSYGASGIVPRPLSEWDGSLAEDGWLAAGGVTGRIHFTAACDTLEGTTHQPVADFAMVVAPAWCDRLGCPGI